MVNEAFGWCCIGLGFLSGGWLGLSFHRPDYLGGYDAYPRRLVRLGHIALIGLGLVNILFAQSVPRLTLTGGLLRAASWCFIIGGASMPLCCFATAVDRRLRPLFAVPVLTLVTAAALTAWGLLSP